MGQSKNAVIGLLLAAGEGKRLGKGPKALLEIDGQIQVIRVLRCMLQGGCSEVHIVVGAEAESVRTALQHENCSVIENRNWKTGLGSSFALGVSKIHQNMGSGSEYSILVALVDQPDVDAAVISQVIGSRDLAKVNMAGYSNEDGALRGGHPILFPVKMAMAAAELVSGDSGGRAWLRSNQDKVQMVDVSMLATGQDIDTPHDLEKWHRSRG